MISARPVFRFAPSPNGYLHQGHALSAILNFETARRLGGRFLLRIEDIDITRSRPEFEQAIYDDLHWLGLDWEKPVRRQSEHFGDYRAALARLESKGLLYRCFCSRGDVARAIADRPGWPRDPDDAPLYPRTCRAMSAEESDARARHEPFCLRLDMQRALALLKAPLSWREFGESDEAMVVDAQPASWGDVMLARKDIPASYHIAVVTDDALQGVTDVMRGRDLYHATSVHRLLQTLLDLPEPNYRHHWLVLDQDGRKLSKSTFAKSLRSLREQGVSAEEVRAITRLPRMATSDD
jgi:glutamyl-Q tRNA(Asp) synthetase